MKPMQAGTLESLSDLNYPVLVTPKLDGIRCLTIERNGKTVAVSRRLKPIPNDHIRALVETLGPGFDGELIVQGEDFNGTSSGVMRQSGAPAFEYHVFDMHNCVGPYIDRLRVMAIAIDDLLRRIKAGSWVKALIPEDVHSPEELLNYEKKMLANGYEGVMIRSVNGPYKYGRSTVREGYLLKLKRFKDDEAEVIGFIEELHNENEAQVDNLGLTERSSHKANKTGKGALGALKCRRPDGVEFKVGTGFSLEQREQFWGSRKTLLGQIVKYRYQEAGLKDKPRFPSFIGFRHEDDM